MRIFNNIIWEMEKNKFVYLLLVAFLWSYAPKTIAENVVKTQHSNAQTNVTRTLVWTQIVYIFVRRITFFLFRLHNKVEEKKLKNYMHYDAEKLKSSLQ